MSPLDHVGPNDHQRGRGHQVDGEHRPPRPHSRRRGKPDLTTSPLGITSLAGGHDVRFLRQPIDSKDGSIRIADPRESLVFERWFSLEACACELRPWVSRTAGEDIVRLPERALAGVGQSFGDALDVVL